MILARGTGEDGSPVYILGLSEGNIERLKDGDPLVIDNNELGFSGATVILYGKTEDDITDNLSRHFNLPS